MTVQRRTRPDDRYNALLEELEKAPGSRAADLSRLDVYARHDSADYRVQAVRNDLKVMEAAGEVRREAHKGTMGQNEYKFFVADRRPEPAPPAPDPPPLTTEPEPWTLEELLYWLSAAEESPQDCLVARSFELNRRKAVAAVRAAIDRRDRNLKGDPSASTR